MASGHTRTQPAFAWSGRPAAAQQSSYEGALKAAETAPQQIATLRRYLRTRGVDGATDAEIARDLDWASNIVTARRNNLMDLGEVAVRWPQSRRPSVKTSLNVVVWVLSECARVEETNG